MYILHVQLYCVDTVIVKAVAPVLGSTESLSCA